MTTSVAVAADLDSFALVLRVVPEDTDDGIVAAVDMSAAQHPTAVVVDLRRGGRRSPTFLNTISNRCAQYAVPLLVAPLLVAPLVAATLALTGPAAALPRLRTYPNVEGALASLPHAAAPASHRRAVTLNAVATAPARARTVAAEAVSAWGMHDLVFASELVASELVSNAVMHAATDVDLMVRRHGPGLAIGVRDRSPRPPQMAAHDPSDVGKPRGRGLFLVSVTAKRWGFLIGSADKVVWAVIER
jgi:anti-sigma regulatory factor (Ser/Thr protein kinase)